MRIAFVYNLKPKQIDFADPEAEFQAEFDTPETINAIRTAIAKNGHEVFPMEANEDLYEKLKNNRQSIDFVFNFAEAVRFRGSDRRAQAPMLYEILQIPYLGATPLSMALILDKRRTKEVWKHWQVPTPKWQTFWSENDQLSQDMPFPLIVKANSQGSSMGIRNNSVVRNEEQLRERVKESMAKFGGPVLVERLLEGREFTVPVLGNGKELEVLPIVEASFDGLPPGTERIDSYEVKWIHDMPNNPNRVESTICPAVVDDGLKMAIEALAKTAFVSVGARDWARVDMRMDTEGKLYALEINCPAGLLPPPDSSKLPISAKAAGIEYDQLIGKVLNIGLKRYGLM